MLLANAGKNNLLCGPTRPFLLVRFLWASKENEQNRESVEKRQAETNKSYGKQSIKHKMLLANAGKNDLLCGPKKALSFGSFSLGQQRK
ncbi:MAG: hypothetical protein CFE24_12970 [Flavobacterium sp. BFFFF2]|nr:MAG: hypothetical protein CFE24_12970 [Flavobacterium sp. BFFFF2]